MSLEIEKMIKRVYLAWKDGILHPKGAHPNEEDFGAFVEGQLPEKECRVIKEHILSCDSCVQVLAAALKLRNSAEIEPPEGLLEESGKRIDKEISGRTLEVFLAARDKLLEIINTTGDVLVGQELVPAGVLRSRKIKDFRDEVTILKDFPELRVELKITAKARGVFDALVFLKEKPGQEPAKGLRISLIKENVELESYLTDSGKAVFEHLVAGKYSLEVSGVEEKTISIKLEINIPKDD